MQEQRMLNWKLQKQLSDHRIFRQFNKARLFFVVWFPMIYNMKSCWYLQIFPKVSRWWPYGQCHFSWCCWWLLGACGGSRFTRSLATKHLAKFCAKAWATQTIKEKVDCAVLIHHGDCYFAQENEFLQNTKFGMKQLNTSCFVFACVYLPDGRAWLFWCPIYYERYLLLKHGDQKIKGKWA